MMRSESATCQSFIEYISPNKIHPSKSPLRAAATGDVGIDDLASSIMEKGLLSPIVVRPLNSYYEVVAGNRRFEACKKLKIKRIPCYVSEFDDREAYEVSLVENVQRKTLDPLEEALAFKKYVDEFGFGSISELARKIGKSHSYVSRKIGLLKLPKSVQEQLLVRSARVGMAEELLSLTRDNADEHTIGVLTDLIAKKQITKNEIRSIVKGMKSDHDMDSVLCNTSAFSDLEVSKEEEDRAIPVFRGYNYLQRVRQHIIERAFSKYTASLKVCLMRLDEVLDSLDNDGEWVMRETLMYYRRSIHRHIDSLMRLKTRTQRLLERPTVRPNA